MMLIHVKGRVILVVFARNMVFFSMAEIERIIQEMHEYLSTADEMQWLYSNYIPWKEKHINQRSHIEHVYRKFSRLHLE